MSINFGGMGGSSLNFNQYQAQSPFMQQGAGNEEQGSDDKVAELLAASSDAKEQSKSFRDEAIQLALSQAILRGRGGLGSQLG